MNLRKTTNAKFVCISDHTLTTIHTKKTHSMFEWKAYAIYSLFPSIMPKGILCVWKTWKKSTIESTNGMKTNDKYGDKKD